MVSGGLIAVGAIQLIGLSASRSIRGELTVAMNIIVTQQPNCDDWQSLAEVPTGPKPLHPNPEAEREQMLQWTGGYQNEDSRRVRRQFGTRTIVRSCDPRGVPLPVYS